LGMIWSVSTSSRISTAGLDVIVSNGSMRF
jgi:hypothetical protein